MINLERPLIVVALAWPIPAIGAFLDANDLYARCDVMLGVTFPRIPGK
jgi:hypothetical protein